MSDVLHRRVTEIYGDALELPADRRPAFLAEVCGSDLALRREVESLLAANDTAEDFLRTPALEVAADILASEQKRELIGQQIGHYRIDCLIGAGGMGQIYRGEDTRLNRPVALKILHPDLTRNPEQLERFRQEARAASSLNHPNIVTVFEVGQQDRYHYLVTEYIEGETLRQLMSVGPLPVEQVLEIGIQAAAALEAAHQAGIVHRDVKPENIMVRRDGYVKLLDFGLAKLLEPARAPQLQTAAGRVLGTVQYMSPEQARGLVVDARTDLFSLASVLYEAVTGVAPFRAATEALICEAVLNRQPAALQQFVPAAPVALNAILQQALEKDRELRYQTASDLKAALRRMRRDNHSSSGISAAVRPVPVRARKRRLAAAGGVLAALVGLGVVVGGRIRQDTVTATDFTPVTQGPGFRSSPSLSPDGNMIVFANTDEHGVSRIYLQRVGGSTAINLTPEGGQDRSEPALSPDGSEIAFRSEAQGGGIFLMGATGENERRLTNFGYAPAWSPDGTQLVFASEPCDGTADRGGLWMAEVASGKLTALATGPAKEAAWSPDKRWIAFSRMDLTGWTQIWLYSVADGNVRPVTEGAASHFQPAWGPEPATVYYASDRGGSRSFWRQRLGSSGAPVADPQPLMVPSSQAGQMTFGGQHPRFAYVVEGGTAGIFRLGWNPATLTAAGPPTLVTPAGERAVEPAVSLDGRWLAYTTGEALRDDIAVLDLMSGARSRRVITRGGPRDHAAAWLGGPAQGLLFWSNRDSQLALWRVQMDGGRLERVPGPAGTDRAALPVGGSPVALSTEQSVRLAEIRSDGALTEGRALPTPPGVSRLHPLAWSGDRSRMVARGTMTDGGSRLWMWDARASQWQDTGASNARQAAFFRDGQGLLLLEGSTLRALDLETSKSHIVFRHGGLHSFAVGREDSRALFVALSQPERSLWVASLGRR